MSVTSGPCARVPKAAGFRDATPSLVSSKWKKTAILYRRASGWLGLVLLLGTSIPAIGQVPATISGSPQANLPPRVVQAQRFLALRGFAPNRPALPQAKATANALVASPQSTSATASWESLGPTGVITANYGLVTGRISSLALDPSDATGNRLFVGTTGGGVWLSQNAATSNPANIV